MAIKYRVASRPKKDGAKPTWTNPLDVMPARDNVVKRQVRHQGQKYKMQEVGDKKDKWGPDRDLTEVREILPARFSGMSIGDTWAVKSNKDGFVVLTRKIEIEPPIVQTAGTPAIDKIYTWLHDKFPGRWENWGICVCRRIQGSSSWSQHAYCNGLDIGGSTGNLDAIAKAATAAAKRGDIPCDQVIWKGYEHVHGGSVYDHYDHVHFTGKPQMSGTPPCAR